MKSTRKKGIFWLAVSWLVARLWWGFEVSRLSILRMKPKAVIQQVTEDPRELPICSWVMERNMLYCLGVNEHIDEIVIKETVLMDPN